jgi:hypothetical protein
MDNLVLAVKKAWAPKRHHRHVSLQNQKPMLLEEVPSPKACKHEPNTTTCCSLTGMKKLLSVLRLPWGHLWYGKSESRKEDSAAVPSVELLKLSTRDLHMLEAIEQSTGKPWYRESYSSFPKPKAHVGKKCATQSLSTCNVTEQRQKSVPCDEPATGIQLPIIERKYCKDHCKTKTNKYSAPESLISWE